MDRLCADRSRDDPGGSMQRRLEWKMMLTQYLLIRSARSRIFGPAFSDRAESIGRFNFFPSRFAESRFIEAGLDTGPTASGVKGSATPTERFRGLYQRQPQPR
jgi:hypothetical protein